MLWAKFRLNPGPAKSKNQPWNLKPVIVWSQHFSDSNWRRQDGLRTISGHQEEDHGEGWPGTGTVFSGQKKDPNCPKPDPFVWCWGNFKKSQAFCENTQRYTLGGFRFSGEQYLVPLLSILSNYCCNWVNFLWIKGPWLRPSKWDLSNRDTDRMKVILDR